MLSKKLLALNIAIAVVGVVLGVWLVRDLAATRPLPPPPAPRKAPAVAAQEEASVQDAAPDRLPAYNVIVSKYLFNPQRTEGAPADVAKPAVPLPPKPVLLGVVVDGPASRAYLEDQATKRVFGYQIGDSVAGGKLEKITDDRIQISRSDGVMEVMLRDPTKPRPAPPPATPSPGAPQPGTAPPAARTDAPGTPAAPGRPPIPPRALRRLPAEQQQQQSGSGQ